MTFWAVHNNESCLRVAGGKYVAHMWHMWGCERDMERWVAHKAPTMWSFVFFLRRTRRIITTPSSLSMQPSSRTLCKESNYYKSQTKLRTKWRLSATISPFSINDDDDCWRRTTFHVQTIAAFCRPTHVVKASDYNNGLSGFVLLFNKEDESTACYCCCCWTKKLAAQQRTWHEVSRCLGKQKRST